MTATLAPYSWNVPCIIAIIDRMFISVIIALSLIRDLCVKIKLMVNELVINVPETGSQFQMIFERF